jgi:hypothetical protein
MNGVQIHRLFLTFIIIPADHAQSTSKQQPLGEMILTFLKVLSLNDKQIINK